MKLRTIDFEKTAISLLLFLLPTQFGRHFFFNFSFINGVKIDYLSIALYVTDILLLSLLVIHRRAFFEHIKRYGMIFFIFGFLFLINIFQSQEPILAIYYIVKLLEMYFVFFLFRYRKITLINAVLPLLMGSFMQLGLALSQFTQHGSMQGIFYYFGERLFDISTPGIAKAVFLDQQILRPYGTFSHPNSLGGFYSLIYATCLFLLKQTHLTKERILVYALMGTSSMLLLLSFSKIVIVTYLFVTILFVIQRHRQSKGKETCLVCVASRLLIPAMISLVFIQTQSDPTSLEQRFTLMQQSFDIMLRTFFLGTGFSQYLYFQSTYPSPYSFFFLQPVHNIFILYTLQVGVITTMFTAYCGLWFVRRYYKHLFYMFIVVCATGLFDHYWLTLQQNMLLVGVLFGYTTHLIDRRVS